MLENYIKESWERLLRNSLDVALDPKMGDGTRAFLYISPQEDEGAIKALIEKRRMTTDHPGTLEIKVLPDDLSVTRDHGILYLPYDYVVPGGRFNEMYAWDSYWIILGLLQDGYAGIARGMVENFIYQIRHYGGKVLNANRTYYLTRSQPPLLAPMAVAVLPSLKKEERGAFLRDVVDALTLEYEDFWKGSRFDAARGLFHYGNSAQGELGLCPEVVFGERDDKGLSHYDKIAAYLRGLPSDDARRQRLLDESSGGLTVAAIAGDRAMRESGFDTSMHMGPYGLEVLDYDPVCLNSLLYVQCELLELMCKELGQPERMAYFRAEAVTLKANIQKYLWNERTGLFGNFNTRENKLSDFPYLTSAYPLWAGIATPQQAARFRDNLSIFETPFGIKGTDRQTGCQWDAPFMWAPTAYFAVAGLHRFGCDEDAKRIAGKFVDTVRRVYERTGANFEKYNADTGDCGTEGIIDVGYSENVIGFGWTNGAAIVLQNWLQGRGDLFKSGKLC
ncbi:MAG: trehalase family glycosidase [Alphaproteobacteria bacterium]